MWFFRLSITIIFLIVDICFRFVRRVSRGHFEDSEIEAEISNRTRNHRSGHMQAMVSHHEVVEETRDRAGASHVHPEETSSSSSSLISSAAAETKWNLQTGNRYSSFMIPSSPSGDHKCDRAFSNWLQVKAFLNSRCNRIFRFGRSISKIGDLIEDKLPDTEKDVKK